MIEILNEIIGLIPGFSERIISNNSLIDSQKILSLTEEIRSETYLFYMNESELNQYISIAENILNRIKLLNEHPEKSFNIVDSILDSIWHQKRTNELSEITKRNLAKLALQILDISNEKYWVNSLAPSASNYNHCIYFIFMLEDRFRNENEEFQAVYNQLLKYIDKYGNNHHLSQRWIIRYESLLKTYHD